MWCYRRHHLREGWHFYQYRAQGAEGRKAVEPVSGSLPDWKITARLPDIWVVGASIISIVRVMDEIASLTRVTGASHSSGWERVVCSGRPSLDHPGTPILHTSIYQGEGQIDSIMYRPS
jgi:predicted molibdopterin-dependent oxidoreductase YjgC